MRLQTAGSDEERKSDSSPDIYNSQMHAQTNTTSTRQSHFRRHNITKNPSSFDRVSDRKVGQNCQILCTISYLMAVQLFNHCATGFFTRQKPQFSANEEKKRR